jgi:hypothetical protein
MPIDSKAETDRYLKDSDKITENDIKLMIRREFDKHEAKHESKQSLWIKLGFILIPLAVTFFLFNTDLSKQIALTNHRVENIEKGDNSIKLEQINTTLIDMRERLIRLETKLEGRE